jgi:hypothetical protein
MNTEARDQLLQRIAAEHLFVETLETATATDSTSTTRGVRGIRQALIDAFEAGRLASSTNTPN